ncbi:hypothetical protein K933_12635 [Candidatus Halobonum tyrrellensis G22]|uniref:Uncharacterized protein n=1 Tax=Candidatus Halobonum tyrrellensis G22 TaxID=1324957 RepID=V4GRH9_9EURY|nr:hypothetical protein K933_12635 [Candidatus Halobonum tyrrellensis G22]
MVVVVVRVVVRVAVAVLAYARSIRRTPATMPIRLPTVTAASPARRTTGSVRPARSNCRLARKETPTIATLLTRWPTPRRRLAASPENHLFDRSSAYAAATGQP